MTRVASIPLQRTMSDAIQRSQGKLAVTQAQLSTGKKATDLASLGTEAVRNLSARTLVAKEEAYAAVAARVGTTLSMYDANISAIEDMASGLREDILEAIGTGKAAGLQDSIEAGFDQFRSALNVTEAGVPLFGGSQPGKPFTPETLADTVGLTPADAFKNDDVRASARLGGELDLRYGVTASELGTDLLAAFQTLAAAGPIGDTPTPAQLDALKQALGELDVAIPQVRAVNADNGRRQAEVETLATRADERALLFKEIISRNEDADLGQVAIDLAQQKTMLQASYSVFGQLSGLSLVHYL